MKYLLKISPYLLIIAGAGTYIFQSLKGEIVDYIQYNDLRDDVVVEEYIDETEETPIINEIEENITEVLEEEIIKEETIETETVEEETKVEIISSELLESGYEFQNIDFETLEEINPDTCAWIKIDGTNIDYPVVQGKDNEYYLKHSIEKKDNSSGTIFIDSRNSSLENFMYDLSDLTLVYGHHMKGSRMFANLCNYSNQSYFEEHPYGVIYTPDGYAYRARIFASVIMPGATDENLYTEDFKTEEEFNEYLKSIMENSIISSDIEINYGDKIIGLVTCEYTQGTNSRQIVYAVLDKQYTNELQMNKHNTLSYVK